jgi:hypothetical protein
MLSFRDKSCRNPAIDEKKITWHALHWACPPRFRSCLGMRRSATASVLQIVADTDITQIIQRVMVAE